MKVTKPAREVTVCDLCSKEWSVLDTCLVCGKEYCYTCHGTMPGCIHAVEVCRKCSERPDVVEVVKRHAGPLRSLISERADALRALPKEQPK